MKKYIFFYFVFTLIIYADGKNSKKIYGRELFPTNATKQFVYESTFGETNTIALIQDEIIQTKTQSNNFKYIQKLELKIDGLYVSSTYQWIKILNIFTHENNITYSVPLRRYALPLYVGKEWSDETTEIIDGDSNKVRLKAKVLAEEEVETMAGKFTAIKIQTITESDEGSKNITTEWMTEDIGLIKSIIEIKGGGLTGVIRDILGLSKLKFELKKIIN